MLTDKQKKLTYLVSSDRQVEILWFGPVYSYWYSSIDYYRIAFSQIKRWIRFGRLCNNNNKRSDNFLLQKNVFQMLTKNHSLNSSLPPSGIILRRLSCQLQPYSLVWTSFAGRWATRSQVFRNGSTDNMVSPYQSKMKNLISWHKGSASETKWN